MLDGLISQMTKAVLELINQLGYEKGDPAGRGSGNSRNGTTRSGSTPTSAPVDFAFPGIATAISNRRLSPRALALSRGFNEWIIVLYARGRFGTSDATSRRSSGSGELGSDLPGDRCGVGGASLDAVYLILYIDAMNIEIP